MDLVSSAEGAEVENLRVWAIPACQSRVAGFVAVWEGHSLAVRPTDPAGSPAGGRMDRMAQGETEGCLSSPSAGWKGDGLGERRKGRGRPGELTETEIACGPRGRKEERSGAVKARWGFEAQAE